jgi:hypothetical protein
VPQDSSQVFLVGDVRLYRIGDEEVRASAGDLCQLRQPLPGTAFSRMLKVVLGVSAMNTF